LEVYNTFVFAQPEDKDKLDGVLNKFDEHCLSKKNKTFERYVFHTRMQHQGETFDNFLTDLKLKAKSCNFNYLRDSMIRDQIVFGTNDKKIREKLLRETELTMESAIKICHASELACQHVLTFNEPAHGAASQHDEGVNAVSIKAKQWKRYRDKNNDDEQSFSCKRCGEKHTPRQCPAYGKMCAKCKGQNHYAKMCLSREKNLWNKVHRVEDSDDSDDLL